MGNETLSSYELQASRTTYLLEHKHKSGKHYISITQTTKKNSTSTIASSISIDPSVLLEVIETLKAYSESIPSRQLDDTQNISNAIRQKIKEAYLKGVTIKDLKVRFNYTEKQLTSVLESQNIAIVHKSELKPSWNPYRKRKRD